MADLITAAVGIVTDLGLLPAILAGAVVALAASLYKKTRR